MSSRKTAGDHFTSNIVTPVTAGLQYHRARKIREQTVKTLLMTGVILTISTCVAAQDPEEGCPWIDRTIPLGDSIYVRDPALIDMYKLYLIDKGMNPDKAEKQAPRSDWVGYTLVCSQVFKPGPADGLEGDVLALDGYALRLADWHVGYWRSPEGAK